MLQLQTSGAPISISKLQLSHSSCSTYRSCHRKLEFAKLRGVFVDDMGLAGEVGHCLHAGYQNWLVEKDEQRAIEAMMLRYPANLNANPANNRSLEACYATLMEMLRHPALLQYEIAQIECLDGVTRPAIEVPFEIVIKDFSLNGKWKHESLGGAQIFKLRRVPDIPIVYIGYIDAILYDRLEDEYVVVDIKTHRISMKDLTAKFCFSEQCLPYGLVLEQMIGDINLGFKVKYLSAYIDIKEPTISLYTFRKTMDDVRDWAQGLLATLHSIQWEYTHNWFQRAGGDTCVTWNKACRYFDICGARNSQNIKELLTANMRLDAPKPFTPWVSLGLEFGKAA